jgi:hypothetical protein
VYSGGETVKPTAMNPGSVRLTPEQEQAVRLETETVQAATGTRGVHTVGYFFRITGKQEATASLLVCRPTGRNGT